jgi:hypothetical protein
MNKPILIALSTTLIACGVGKPTYTPASITSYATGDHVINNSIITIRGNAPALINETDKITTEWLINNETVCSGTPQRDGSTECTITASGTVEITLKATLNGTEHSTATVSVVADIENKAPVCSLKEPAADLIISPKDKLNFVGEANDPDGNIEALTVRWSSDKDGLFGTTKPNKDGSVSFEHKELSLGPHHITMAVSDSHGGQCLASVKLRVSHFYKATKEIRTYKYIDLKDWALGVIRKGSVFAAYEPVGPSYKCQEGVLRVAADTFVCSKFTEKTDDAPIAHPRIIEFVPPTPTEFKSKEFKKNYTWPALDGRETFPPFMPSVHGRFSRPKNALYKDVASYVNEENPTENLPSGRRYAFHDAIKTEKGWLLQRESGEYLPMEKLKIDPIDRFKGRLTSENPILPGTTPGFALRKDAKIYERPTKKSTVLRKATHREELNLLPKRTKGYYEIPNFDGTGKSAYIASGDVRRWIPTKRPRKIRDDEVWVDVDTSVQMLSLFKGDKMLFTTLISGGSGKIEVDQECLDNLPEDGLEEDCLNPHVTPEGIYTIYVKHARTKMQGDGYYMEDVPWVMYFFEAFAIHAAYWHSSYGYPRSHGCVNMSLHDIRYIFENVNPQLPEGWNMIQSRDHKTDTTVRVRRGKGWVEDFRSMGRWPLR